MDEPEDDWDGASWLPEFGPEPIPHPNGHAEAFRPPAQATSEQRDIDHEITRLTKLRAVEYEKECKPSAEKLGIRATTLDKLVTAARPKEDRDKQGRAITLLEHNPWPEPVAGGELVAEMMNAIRRYVILTEDDALAVTLWILHVYCFDAFSCTPRLAITSPEKQCGKTTLLDVVKAVVTKALGTESITTASVFRTIEMHRPTLLIDEADTFLGDNEELRGILNSGHRIGGQVIRTVGDDFEPRAFSTHCPCVISMIGKLPDTLADRSVRVSMRRKAPGESAARYRIGRTPDLAEVARKAARWADDNIDAIRSHDPEIPTAIYNRAADNWEPLLSVADIAGGDWPGRARQAALAACGGEEDQSYGASFLSDIREAFAASGRDRMSSASLVAALVGMPDRPWGECNHGKALTQNGLANRLKKYGIKTETIRIDDATPKGFHVGAFSDVFSRYCPDSGFHSATPQQDNNIKSLSEKPSATIDSAVALQTSRNDSKNNVVVAVALQKRESTKEDHVPEDLDKNLSVQLPIQRGSKREEFEL